MERPAIRGLVISGGGAFGACGAGTLAAFNRHYDLVSGVSTGSLMGPLVGLREWDRLKVAYTSVTQRDIFDVNPFHENGKIRILNAIWRIVRGKKTLGESRNLRKTIDRFLTNEDFQELKRREIEVFVAAQETSHYPESVHYFSSKDCLPDDLRDWIWASANAPVVTSILGKDFTDAQGVLQPGQWCDGGVTELLSLQEVVNRGATEVDVILHRYVRPTEYKGPAKDFFHQVVRLFDLMRKEIEGNDLQAGLLTAELEGCVVNVYTLPGKLADNSLIFDPARMSAWWELGFRTANDPARLTRFDFVSYPKTGLPP